MCDSRFDTDQVPQSDSTTIKTHYISKTMITRLILDLFKINVLYYGKETKPSDAHDIIIIIIIIIIIQSALQPFVGFRPAQLSLSILSRKVLQSAVASGMSNPQLGGEPGI
jgi:hypothetical protein